MYLELYTHSIKRLRGDVNLKISKKIVSIVLASIVVMTTTGCLNTNVGASSYSNGEKDIIRLAQNTDVKSFDPHQANDSSTSNATRHIFNTLIKLTPEDTFEGDLAESWEQVDDTTVKFKLKDGVKFHNGEILTSDDVKFSLERQKESSKVGHLVDMIESIEVIDDLNFIIHLNKKSSTLISSLSHIGGAILNKKSVEEIEASGKKIDENPIGTGPYKFEAWKPGDRFILIKFDDYFDGEVKNDGLEFRIIPEGSSRAIALETGEIDVLLNVDAVDYNRIRDNIDLVLNEYSPTTIEFLDMNNEKAPFDNKLVREAINYATDKASIIAVSTNGEAIKSEGIMGPTSIGYSNNVVNYDYNLKKAKSLLKQAGYDNNLEFTILASSDVRSKTAQVYQASLAEIGVKVNVEMMESGAMLEKQMNGDFQAAVRGWNPNAEPDNTFAPLYLTENKGSGGNRTFYSNEKVDSLIREGRIEQDEIKRNKIYEEIQQIITKDAAIAPIYTPLGAIGTSSKIEGLEIYPIGTHRYENISFKK
ncbi:hypothetical protein CHL78_006530 [Romboutsia weinsteinii]|uniref:Solute-binding protein family 5 domain-containing protein n=1 Tax=Romboutsia weinsteinii TaxID=2020949 RepID=A0A371J6E6_9FIRM|nr:hypothetical protein CHL78_006530 [Romboutsia weinsteinii]